MTKSCIIIGAGLTGLTAADVLSQNGWRVLLLDKGRHAGGRMATRRLAQSRFDHGAQFFTVRDSRFQRAVDSWQARGLATPWFSDGGHVRYRGIDGMRGIAESLAKPFELRTATTVQRVEASQGNWHAHTAAGELFTARCLLLTTPAPQAVALLAACLDSLPAPLVSSLKSVTFDPCFALMVVADAAARIPNPGYLRLEEGPVAYIADNTQKGISAGPPALTIHARPGFTRSYFDAPGDEVTRLMLQAAQPCLRGEPVESHLHRWRYSQPSASSGALCLFAAQPAPLAIAGDGFGGPRLEGAFLSGLAAAGRILTS